MATQTLQDKLGVITAFKQSKYWNPRVKLTENNLQQVRVAIDGEFLTIPKLVEIFDRLIKEGRLELVDNEPKVITVEKIVERKETPGALQDAADIRKVKAGFHVQHKTSFDRDDERQEAERDKRSPQQKAFDAAQEQGQRESKAETLHIINSYVYEDGGKVWRGITESRRKKLQTVINPKDWRVSLDAVRAMRNAFKTDLKSALNDLRD